MKHSIIVALMLISMLAQSQQQKVRFFDFETAIVEYTYEGNETGKQIMYIDQYGWKRAEWTNITTKMLGQTTEKKQIMVSIGLDVWQWDPIARTGTRVHNQMLENLMKDPQFDPEKYAKETMENLGFQKTGTEIVQGKNCEVWKGMGSTIWIWNGLGIKTEVKLLGQKTTWTATKIDLNVKVPQDKFTIPSDIKFGEAQSNDPMEIWMKALQEQDIENNPNDTGKKSDSSETQNEAPMNLKELRNLLKKSR